MKHDDELTVEHDRRVTIKNDCAETVSEGTTCRASPRASIPG
ncbi:hypothetical protein N4G58_07890 [Edwardsiella piscicida]|nr:hypothetical protein N4G58_07890 [Edwardsiella piscicida]